MPHQPVDLENRTWEESRLFVSAEITRLADNIHALRGDVHAYNLRIEAQSRDDRKSIDDDIRAGLLRVAVLEAKVIFYGVAAGAIGMAIMNWLMGRMH